MLKKVLSAVWIIVILLILSAVLLYFKTTSVLHTALPLEEPKIIQIENGASLKKIAYVLQQNGVIKNELYFILYAKFNKLYPKIKAGEYMFEGDTALVDVANTLAEGKLYLRKITFAEGLSSREIADILYQNDLLEGDFEDIAEGCFMPETYTFSRGEQRQTIVTQAKKAMQNFLQNAWDERDTDLPLKNKEELLILASIIEKETGVSQERAQIASVFINRLKKGMLLQTDPTVIYALTHGKSELKRPLTRKDLAVDDKFNTYKYTGLPPAPICNPGKAAIVAAAHPDKTPYLYFVASGSGGHNFATTLSEHNANVRRWKNR